MDRNIRIAKELVRIASVLVADGKDDKKNVTMNEVKKEIKEVVKNPTDTKKDIMDLRNTKISDIGINSLAMKVPVALKLILQADKDGLLQSRNDEQTVDDEQK